MLLSHFVIFFVLVILSELFLSLGLNLAIELITDQALSLLITKDGLLLLFVMKEGVELLDGCPLIVLVNFREDFGGCFFRRHVRSSISTS
jgi:hypothetical protein